MGVCCVVGCESHASSGHKMFNFPRNPIRRKLWEDRVKRKDWKATDFTLICRDHFEDHQVYTKTNGRLNLKNDAVPTIFPHNPDKLSVDKPTSEDEPQHLLQLRVQTKSEKQDGAQQSETENTTTTTLVENCVFVDPNSDVDFTTLNTETFKGLKECGKCPELLKKVAILEEQIEELKKQNSSLISQAASAATEPKIQEEVLECISTDQRHYVHNQTADGVEWSERTMEIGVKHDPARRSGGYATLQHEVQVEDVKKHNSSFIVEAANVAQETKRQEEVIEHISTDQRYYVHNQTEEGVEWSEKTMEIGVKLHPARRSGAYATLLHEDKDILDALTKGIIVDHSDRHENTTADFGEGDSFQSSEEPVNQQQTTYHVVAKSITEGPVNFVERYDPSIVSGSRDYGAAALSDEPNLANILSYKGVLKDSASGKLVGFYDDVVGKPFLFGKGYVFPNAKTGSHNYSFDPTDPYFAEEEKTRQKPKILLWCESIDWRLIIEKGGNETVKKILEKGTFDIYPGQQAAICQRKFVAFVGDTFFDLFSKKVGFTKATLEEELWPGSDHIKIIMRAFDNICPGLCRPLGRDSSFSPVSMQLHNKFDYIKGKLRRQLKRENPSLKFQPPPKKARIKEERRDSDAIDSDKSDVQNMLKRKGDLCHATNWCPSVTPEEREEMEKELMNEGGEIFDLFSSTWTLQRWDCQTKSIKEQLEKFIWLNDPDFQLELFSWIMSEKFKSTCPTDYLRGKAGPFLEVAFPYFARKWSEENDAPVNIDRGDLQSQLWQVLVQLEDYWPNGAILRVPDAYTDEDILAWPELSALPTIAFKGKEEKSLVVVVDRTIVARTKISEIFKAHCLAVNGFFTFALEYNTPQVSTNAKKFWTFLFNFLWELPPMKERRRYGGNYTLTKATLNPQVSGLWLTMLNQKK